MSVLLPLDQIAETGLRMDTGFKLYNRDLSAYITVGGGGFAVTGTLDVGRLTSPMTAAQVLVNGNTIVLPATGMNKALSSAAAVTGIILTAGVTAGQMIYLMNVNAADAITFDATPATSNVALASAVIVAGTGRFFSWNATTLRWYPNTV